MVDGGATIDVEQVAAERDLLDVCEAQLMAAFDMLAKRREALKRVCPCPAGKKNCTLCISRLSAMRMN